MIKFAQPVSRWIDHPDSDEWAAEVDLKGGWVAKVTFREKDQQMAISRVLIEPSEGQDIKGGVSAEILRSLKLGEIHSQMWVRRGARRACPSTHR